MMSRAEPAPTKRATSGTRLRGTLEESFDLQHNAIAFLRVALSALVVLGHSWELGGFGADPLARYCGVSLGVFAVHAFFAIGGFLVAGSLEHSHSARRYLANRALRIFPGYWACLVVTAVVLPPLAGLLFARTGVPVTAIDGGSQVRYVVVNWLLRIYQPALGSLFADHPAAGVINGSLWSLFPEMLCYTFLAVAAGAGRRFGRRWLLLCAGGFAWILYASTPKLLAAVAGSPWEAKLWYLLQLDSLLTYFCGGALLWMFRTVVPFSRAVRCAALLIVVAALASGAYRILGPISLPPAMLALATLLPWHRFDRHGDFSYGLYLYHYPVQQVLYGIGFRPASPLQLFAASLSITLPLAWLSWRCIERPALALKPQSLRPRV